MDTGLFLENFPKQLVSIVRPLAGFNSMLLRASLQRLLSPDNGFKEHLALQKAVLDFSFFISKSESGQMFLFIKRKKKATEVVVDASIHFAVEPVPEGDSIIGPISPPTIFYWTPPPFLLLDARALDRIAPPDALPNRVIGLTDGGTNNLLVEFGKDKEAKARLWHNERLVEAAGSRRWPAGPFFEIYRGIREWATGKWASDKNKLLELNTGSDIGQIIHTIAASFAGARRALSAAAQPEPHGDFLQTGKIHYGLSGFRAHLALRLDEEGMLALHNSKKSFQLGLQTQLCERGNLQEMRIEMGIPDFLTGGDLYKAFWDVFLYREGAEGLRGTLLRLFAENGYSITGEELLALLETGSYGKGTVFRIDRERKTDVNLFIVTGTVNGKHHSIVFSGKFEVESATPPKIRFRGKNTLKAHFWPEENSLDQDIVDYFLRLAKYFKNWKDLILE